MNMVILYASYFLVITSILSKSCLSVPMKFRCPHDTNCVLATSCPTVTRLLDQNKTNIVKEMYCEHERGQAKVCCPSSETIIEFRSAETEMYYKPTERINNKNYKLTFPIDTSTTTYQYKSQTTKTYSTNMSPFPNKTICGQERVSDRIVGGSVADIDEFPWLARLQYKDKLETYFGCGASLITDRYLITAGHCLVQDRHKQLVSVRLGEWDEDTERDCQKNYCAEKPLDIDIEKVFIYNNVNQIKDTLSADIGLIKLKESVKFSEFISPICIPHTEYVQMQVNAHAVPYWTAGWGVTEFEMPSTLKRKLSLYHVPTDLCKMIFKNLEKSLYDRVICAGGIEGEDTCMGDSGGPLMKKVEEDYRSNWYLFGITSTGNRQCGKEGVPGVYTKVSVYMDWIQSVISTS